MEVDTEFIGEQMLAEGQWLRREGVAPLCYFCTKRGPGLYWLPSEEGVIEMAVWSCATCICEHEELLRQTQQRLLRQWSAE